MVFDVALISDEIMIGHGGLHPPVPRSQGGCKLRRPFSNRDPPAKALVLVLGTALSVSHLPGPLCLSSVWAETPRAVNLKLYSQAQPPRIRPSVICSP
jgi:hypothetical protein